MPHKFRLPEPFLKPILSSEPSVSIHQLQREDHFLIFASDGLWEHLSNQDAVDIVKNYPRKVRSMRSYPILRTSLNSEVCFRKGIYSKHKCVSKMLAHCRTILYSTARWDSVYMFYWLNQEIARRLIEAALKEAAKKREMRYSDMKRIECGVRRHFHDDISVIVLFLDPRLASTKSSLQRSVSIKGAGMASAPAADS